MTENYEFVVEHVCPFRNGWLVVGLVQSGRPRLGMQLTHGTGQWRIAGVGTVPPALAGESNLYLEPINLSPRPELGDVVREKPEDAL